MKEYLVSESNKLSLNKVIGTFLKKKRKNAKIYVERHCPFNGVVDIKMLTENFIVEDLFQDCSNFEIDLFSEDSEVLTIEFEHSESTDVTSLPVRNLVLNFKAKIIEGVKNNHLLYIGPPNEHDYRDIWRIIKK
jgi:hypothetical protein